MSFSPQIFLCRYEGAYLQSMRQGTGVYYYAGSQGGVYIGEWLKGRMNGQGLILYPDGEYYIGNWRDDKKEGVGVRKEKNGRKYMLTCPKTAIHSTMHEFDGILEFTSPWKCYIHAPNQTRVSRLEAHRPMCVWSNLCTT